MHYTKNRFRLSARQRLLLGLLLGNLTGTFGQMPGPAVDFKGRYIVAVSDADMVPSAYVDDQLGPAAGPDALSVVRLDKPIRDWKAVELGVSNSVAGPPSSVAVSPDGRYAVVIETRGPRQAGNARLSGLAKGRLITVIDLNDPDQPKAVQRIDGPEKPVSVSFSADGSLVAIAAQPSNPSQQPLTIGQFAGGKLTNLSQPTLPGWTAGDVLYDAAFHPKSSQLAVLNATRSALSLVNVTHAGSQISLSAWGKPVGVDREPYKAVFTPDGRFVLVNSMYSATTRGSVESVELAVRTNADGTPVHELVSRALTGLLPEGLTVSPNGQWVVTTNLEQSYHPLDSPRQGFFSSVTLLRLDPVLGRLERVGDYAFDGMLPESAVFDNSSRFLAVANFEPYTNVKPGGSIDIWRLAGDYSDPRRVELVKSGYSIPVTRGVHSMVIAR